MSLDLGDFVLDADKYGVILHRKKSRLSKTGESIPYLDLVGHYGSFAQTAARLAHMSAAEAVSAGATVKQITAAVEAAASRIETAITTNQGAKS